MGEKLITGASSAEGAADEAENTNDLTKTDTAILTGLNLLANADGHAADYSQYSPLALAYIGDAVYELIVRDRIVREGSRQVNKLHHEAVHYVNAGAQSKLILKMQPLLTPQELRIYKRGRNAVSHTVPKNQDVADYRRATGFEALVGWLFLNGSYERILELLKSAQRSGGQCGE